MSVPAGKVSRSFWLRMLTWVVLIYLGFGTLLFATQRSLMYFPVAENPASDVPFETVRSADERLKLWVVSAGKPDAVIYFGGNAEDVSANLAMLKAILPGYSLFLVNYRGYGGSEGKPSEQALFGDALAPAVTALRAAAASGHWLIDTEPCCEPRWPEPGIARRQRAKTRRQRERPAPARRTRHPWNQGAAARPTVAVSRCRDHDPRHRSDPMVVQRQSGGGVCPGHQAGAGIRPLSRGEDMNDG